MGKRSKAEGLKRLACIDVGSGALEMIIVETDGEKTTVLETLRQSTMLGSGCYADGVIDRDSIRDTCSVLRGFRALVDEYKVDALSVVATSAIREARNRDWVLDQIHLTTGLDVTVLNNAQERGFILSSLANVPDYARLRREGVLVIDVGYGSTQIFEIRGGDLITSRNMKVGALRLRELIASVADTNPRYPELLERYIMAELHHLRPLVHLEDIRHCVALSGEADRLIAMMDARPTLKRYNHLYLEAKSMTSDQMEMRYGIPAESAEIVLPTMMVIKAFIEMTGAEALNLYSVTLKDAVISRMRAKLFHPGTAYKLGDKTKMSMARALAANQGADMLHARDVERKAAILFDASLSLHGMTRRERLLLRLAAAMHDMGKRISTFEHGVQSAHILKANPIIGLSDEEMNITAFVVEYHDMRDTDKYRMTYAMLDEHSRIYAVKLMALLLMADALDAGSQQKLTIISAQLTEDRLLITARADGDALLEKWAFETKSALFAEVFGFTAQLRIKMIV